MGTTAEKLQKVLDTKNDIKAAIRETGTTVLDDETFASYPDKIRNNLVKPTGNVDIVDTTSTDVSHAATAQIPHKRHLGLWNRRKGLCQALCRRQPQAHSHRNQLLVGERNNRRISAEGN